MIAKPDHGKGFKGLVNYVMKEMKNAKILLAEGVLCIDKESIIDSFNLPLAMRPNRKPPKEPVGHIPIAFSPQDADKLTDDMMAQIVAEFCDMVGIRNTTMMFARHYDTEHPHGHLVWSRVDNEGNLMNESFFNNKCWRACRQLEEKYGLVCAIKKREKKPSRGKVNNKDMARIEMREKIEKAVQEARTWHEFKDLLRKENVTMFFRASVHGKGVVGVVFSDGEYKFSGSHIGKEFGLQNLDRLFGGELAKENYGCLEWLSAERAKEASKDFCEAELSSLRIVARSDEQLDYRVQMREIGSATIKDFEWCMVPAETVLTLVQAPVVAAAVLIAPVLDDPVSIGTGGGSSDNSTKTDDDREREREAHNHMKPKQSVAQSATFKPSKFKR